MIELEPGHCVGGCAILMSRHRNFCLGMRLPDQCKPKSKSIQSIALCDMPKKCNSASNRGSYRCRSAAMCNKNLGNLKRKEPPRLKPSEVQQKGTHVWNSGIFPVRRVHEVRIYYLHSVLGEKRAVRLINVLEMIALGGFSR